MRLKFQADADFNHRIVVGLCRREPSLDILSASEGGTLRLSDPEVLAAAAKSGRIVLSHDRRTMPAHFSRFISQQSSPGLIVVAQSLDIGSAIEDLLIVWETTEAEEWAGQIGFVPLQ